MFDDVQCEFSLREALVMTMRKSTRYRAVGQAAFACLMVFSLLLMFGMAPAFGQDYWTGDGADNLWSNPDNWASGDVPIGGEIRINGPEAEGDNGPLIADGVEAVAGVLIADAGNPVMNMTGGHLELTGWGSWWADAGGTLATMNMSGGVVEFTGDPGIMEIGWQEPTDPGGSSVGIWNMTGGEIFAKGVDMPGKNYGGLATLNLWGGTMNVGLARGGLIMYEGGKLDITEGTLILEGDQTFAVNDYVDNGWMTAYGGTGTLSINYDGDYTTVVAISKATPGDFDGNSTLDAADIDLLNAEIRSGANNASFDLTQDNLVDQNDRTRWVKDLRKTWFGDANMDGEFNSADFVGVFQLGQYEDGVAGNSTWVSGDWNGDTEFDSADFVYAFQDGGYERGPLTAVANVPEPSLGVLIAGCLLFVVRRGKGQL
jgi:hypothetical protein